MNVLAKTPFQLDSILIYNMSDFSGKEDSQSLANQIQFYYGGGSDSDLTLIHMGLAQTLVSFTSTFSTQQSLSWTTCKSKALCSRLESDYFLVLKLKLAADFYEKAGRKFVQFLDWYATHNRTIT
jgi:hypothetical protein